MPTRLRLLTALGHCKSCTVDRIASGKTAHSFCSCTQSDAARQDRQPRRSLHRASERGQWHLWRRCSARHRVRHRQEYSRHPLHACSCSTMRLRQPDSSGNRFTSVVKSSRATSLFAKKLMCVCRKPCMDDELPRTQEKQADRCLQTSENTQRGI